MCDDEIDYSVVMAVSQAVDHIWRPASDCVHRLRKRGRTNLPFSQAGGALLFHLRSRLYEHASVIITTNLVFAEWVNVFIYAKLCWRAPGFEQIAEN